MAINQTNKITWLVTVIRLAGKITFEELDQRWRETDMSRGAALSKRTFHKWVAAVLDTFGLIISNENVAPYRYFIENARDLEEKNSLQQWLLGTYAVSNSLLESRQVQSRILLENVPSSQQYLTPIIEAMKRSALLEVTYHSYWRPAARPHTLAPYAVKLYRQRWYVVALALEADKVLIFALDRIRSLTVTSRAFTYPADFFPDVYFRDSFGIFADDGTDPETVRLKVCASQANYLRDLPLHASQREVRRDEDYSLFEFHLRPTFDFMQEILWNGDTMEVLAPLWLRRQVAAKARRIWALNKGRGTEEE